MLSLSNYSMSIATIQIVLDTDERFEEYLAFQKRIDKPVVILTFNPFCGLANYLQGLRGMVVLSEVLNFALRSHFSE